MQKGYQNCDEKREGRDYLHGGNDAEDMPYLRNNEGGEDNRGEGKKMALGKKTIKINMSVFLVKVF